MACVWNATSRRSPRQSRFRRRPAACPRWCSHALTAWQAPGLSLINDILDLSKVEAGGMELDLSEFDLSHAIENALILVRERASRRGIMLGRAIDERVGTIRADERKVK